jgi:Trk-type K+ transport system membrane component
VNEVLKRIFGSMMIYDEENCIMIRFIICLYTQLLQSLMQLFVHQFYTSTTCFGHIGPSSGTIAIVAKAVSL